MKMYLTYLLIDVNADICKEIFEANNNQGIEIIKNLLKLMKKESVVKIMQSLLYKI